ncbi:MAG: hypothetical protein A2167_01555 [Planctomycetes bacterium RBG_13_46_10]|nr:MAG: hypothetical protein A2167_01555 [Planctomycetes bacterium RBG_13_46_10]
MRFLQIMRPLHWVKNVFIFAAVIFGKKLIGPSDEVLSAIGYAIGGFICFSLAASAVYIFNDVIDQNADRSHPTKCKRPIAAGSVSIGSALVLSAICATAAITGSLMLDNSFTLIILSYIVLMIFYSILLKKIMILDCVVISIGFCLRAIAGAVIINVPISPWLIICTFALCLFLAFGKRRSEIALLGDDSESFRKTLAGYTPELLSHMLDVTSGLAVICFLLYAMDDRTLHIFGTNNLVYTTPLVLYCIFRFSALIQQGRFSGFVELIIHDLPFQIGLALWIISCIAIIYAKKFGF